MPSSQELGGVPGKLQQAQTRSPLILATVGNIETEALIQDLDYDLPWGFGSRVRDSRKWRGHVGAFRDPCVYIGAHSGHICSSTALLGSSSCILRNSLMFAGDEFSVPDPDAGPYKSKRSLPRIWKDCKTCAASGVKFDMCNTVNLDNEVSKLQDHMENGIVVPSFAAAHLGREDNVLLSLTDYLTTLAKECHGDVREYMKLFSFTKGGSSMHRALPPASAFELEPDEMVTLMQRLSEISIEPAKAIHGKDREGYKSSKGSCKS